MRNNRNDDTIILFCKTGKGSPCYAEAPTASSWKTGLKHYSAVFTFSSFFHTYFSPVKVPVDFRNLYTSYSTINKPFHDIYVVIYKQLHLITKFKWQSKLLYQQHKAVEF